MVLALGLALATGIAPGLATLPIRSDLPPESRWISLRLAPISTTRPHRVTLPQDVLEGGRCGGCYNVLCACLGRGCSQLDRPQSTHQDRRWALATTKIF